MGSCIRCKPGTWLPWASWLLQASLEDLREAGSVAVMQALLPSVLPVCRQSWFGTRASGSGEVPPHGVQGTTFCRDNERLGKAVMVNHGECRRRNAGRQAGVSQAGREARMMNLLLPKRARDLYPPQGAQGTDWLGMRKTPPLPQSMHSAGTLGSALTARGHNALN